MENLKETVDIVVNSRYPEMNREGRELLAQVLIRKELEKGEMLLKGCCGNFIIKTEKMSPSTSHTKDVS